MKPILLSFILGLGIFLTAAEARTWTSAEGGKTFEGELESYNPSTGEITVVLPNRKRMTFHEDKLSAVDITWLKKNGKPSGGGKKMEVTELPDALPDPDGKDADMSKPVQVYILMGQSNMLGFGKPSTLQGIAAEKYPYLVNDANEWTTRKDVRNVRVMCSGNSPAKDHNNEWMTIKGNIGPEIGIGHYLGHVTDAPVMILKTCIGNRSLGWDLLPPGTVPWKHDGKMQPGYRGTPEDPVGNGEPVEGKWYAGCQYDGDVAAAKKVLENLDKYYPGAKEYEVAGFFWWQGDKDMRNAAHFESYEKNLIQLIKELRREFEAPEARFVTASLGQTQKGSKGGDGKILDAMEAVSKNKDPELEDKVAFVYTNPLSKGGSSSGHYSGSPETYMNVGEAMGKAMVELLSK
ncbi:sialate O-acetylesterase [Akkermansiaceae bacterium]|nr:sialate O-acetylesterase [Akkermansiaceae bacterium]MDB4259741.1 sialate O-acetylesterase [Akkermansiaceae bacterium]MDB4387898.1 sialate O-acetylesterase [Akkermansiaceae bacterium]